MPSPEVSVKRVFNPCGATMAGASQEDILHPVFNIQQQEIPGLIRLKKLQGLNLSP
jgi:hypothetical protein